MVLALDFYAWVGMIWLGSEFSYWLLVFVTMAFYKGRISSFWVLDWIPDLKFSRFGVCENRVTVSSISHNFSFLNFYFVSVILMRKLPKWLYQQLKNLLMTWKRYILCYSHQTSSYGNPISLQLASWIWLFYIVWLSDHCRISLSKLLLLWSGINTK
jgi:hypothetical protein